MQKSINGVNFESTEEDLEFLTTVQSNYEELLASSKSEKIAQIKFERDNFQYSNIEFLGTKFSANQTVQSQIIAKLQGKELTDSIAWFDIYGNPIPTTVQGLQDLKNAIEERATQAYVMAYRLIKDVNACSSIDDILDKKGNVISPGVNGIQIQF